jgi:class 3 adenylate cyclase
MEHFADHWVGAHATLPYHSAGAASGEVLVTREKRRLAAIVAADVVGYSRLMGRIGLAGMSA